MGKNNTIVKRWLSDKKRSADLFNAEVFKGKQIVDPKDLEIISGESDIIIKDKKGKERGITRYRDIVMRWKYGVDFMILAIENQNKVHYAMPVRNMVYDGLAYTEQIERLWKERMSNKDAVSDKEFLSKCKKDDTLNPVITLVFYYGEEPWDGAKDIYGMLGLDEKFPELNEVKKYIPNYHINLIDVSQIEDVSCYVSDLQHVFSVVKCKDSKEQLARYVNEHSDFFKRLDIETYHMMQLLLKIKEWFPKTTATEKKGEVDMCKALEDLYAEGIEKGIEKGIQDLILKKYSKGLSEEAIAEFLEMSVEMVRRIISEGNIGTEKI